jgi:hypothetical protein
MLRKRSNKAPHSALVIEARAGLIPESDWTAAEVCARKDRTARTGRVIKSHAKLKRSSQAAAVSEMLTDLRHYCDSKKLPFEKLDSEASENYEHEVSQSRTVDSPLM